MRSVPCAAAIVRRVAADPLVLGIDAGGTSTRCVVCTRDGDVVGRGGGGGASPLSSSDPHGALVEALSRALAGLDPGRVTAVAAGVAGSSTGAPARVAAILTDVAGTVGLTAHPRLVPDLATSFAAGTASTDGLLVLAGTGAIAAWFADGELRHRADGHGWWLGDAGSAVWQGHRAVQAVLAAADGRAPATALTAAVTAALGLPADDQDAKPGADGGTQDERDAFAHAVIAAVHAAPPAAIGRLAPLVRDLAPTDSVAADIAAAAAAELLRTADAVLARAGARAGSAVVVAGSVLTTDGPVARAVEAGLVDRTGTPVRRATDPAAGAAVLALRQLGWLTPAAHTRLTGSTAEPEVSRSSG